MADDKDVSKPYPPDHWMTPRMLGMTCRSCQHWGGRESDGVAPCTMLSRRTAVFSREGEAWLDEGGPLTFVMAGPEFSCSMWSPLKGSFAVVSWVAEPSSLDLARLEGFAEDWRDAQEKRERAERSGRFVRVVDLHGLTEKSDG